MDGDTLAAPHELGVLRVSLERWRSPVPEALIREPARSGKAVEVLRENVFFLRLHREPQEGACT